MKKQFKGKAIYNPSGKAGEYSYWACNFYTGCSNGCEYCYCRRGVMAHSWSDVPRLKKCFENEDHALGIFEKELVMNKEELQKHGLFFSFTTDPMLEETRDLTFKAAILCIYNDVPVKILTKRTDFAQGIWFHRFLTETIFPDRKNLVAFGFTLTGLDEKEPGASKNFDRTYTMGVMKGLGFKTFASIEPVIDFDLSLEMIRRSAEYCDLFKIGLLTGQKITDEVKYKLSRFVWEASSVAINTGSKIYWKESITRITGDLMRQLEIYCAVGRDYDLFERCELHELI